MGRFMSPEITPRRYGGTYPDGQADIDVCERREFVYQPIRLGEGEGGEGGGDSSDGEDDEFHEVLHPRHFGLEDSPRPFG